MTEIKKMSEPHRSSKDHIYRFTCLLSPILYHPRGIIKQLIYLLTYKTFEDGTSHSITTFLVVNILIDFTEQTV